MTREEIFYTAYHLAWLNTKANPSIGKSCDLANYGTSYDNCVNAIRTNKYLIEIFRFPHNFARAFFGMEYEDHLRRMAVAEDPVLYLKDFL